MLLDKPIGKLDPGKILPVKFDTPGTVPNDASAACLVKSVPAVGKPENVTL